MTQVANAVIDLPVGDSAADPGADVASSHAVLIGLDWGTTSLRSYLFDATGRIMARAALPWGVMRLPAHDSRGSAFDLAFDAACGAWLAKQADLPVIACGMVGSAQGWIEVPYVEGQADAAVLAQAMVAVPTSQGCPLHIVPGVLERGALPNVMRGEETQIVGVSLSRSRSESAINGVDVAPTLIGLPGTHAKWALSEDGRIGHFDTFMTGEVYAILRDHSILGRTMAPSRDADTAQVAFLRGIAVARKESETSLLATIFSVRTMGLIGELEAEQQGDYLSGLLIGNELLSLEKSLFRQDGLLLRQRSIVLSGEAGLCERYRTALAAWGCASVDFVRDATERGLWHIAVHAGLVAAAGIDNPGADALSAAPAPTHNTESVR